MHYRLWISTLILLFCLVAAASAATNPQDAAALVYVSGYESDPQVFYPYETGTITVHVTNAANASVGVSQPNLIDDHFHILNRDSFSTTTNIGPGSTVDYTFLVTVDPPEGTHFPIFTVSSDAWGAQAIHSTLKVKVDSTDVRASIAKKPDAFSLSKKDTVNVSIVNPRDGDVTDVLIIPEGPGVDVSPSESYIGTLKAGSSVQVPFQVTPGKPTDLTFHVSFRNGDNKHTTDLILPLALGEDKMGAELVVNNIASSVSGGTTTLKGDVTNNGLTDAKSVLVTVGSPANPINPNPVYAIGNLQPDDFSSFEVTYTTTGTGPVPILVEFKDTDGSVFHESFSFSASTNTGVPGAAGVPNAAIGSAAGPSNNRRGGLFGSFGSGFGQIPVTEIVIGLIAIVVLLVAWRKGLLRRLANKFRKDPLPESQPRER